MNVHSMPISPDELPAELNRKVARAAEAIGERYGSAVSEPQRDHLLAFYVLGLTVPFYEDGSPASHLHAVRTHLLAVMPLERANAAIDTAPLMEGEWFPGALRAIESIGHRDGHALFMQCDDFRRIHHTNNDQRQEAGPAASAGIRNY